MPQSSVTHETRTSSVKCMTEDSYSPRSFLAIRSSCHFRIFPKSSGSLSEGNDVLVKGGRRGGASTFSSSRSAMCKGLVGKLGGMGGSLFRFPFLTIVSVAPIAALLSCYLPTALAINVPPTQTRWQLFPLGLVSNFTPSVRFLPAAAPVRTGGDRSSLTSSLAPCPRGVVGSSVLPTVAFHGSHNL